MWRQTVVQNWSSNGKYTAYFSNSDKSGDSKTFVATIVANVVVTTVLNDVLALEKNEGQGMKISFKVFQHL
jgi:hypothetical protein